jgi:pimeloyl-ACP methyl ester carboxylesterase
MIYPLIELGGVGRVMHIAPANGFPPETYLPMLKPFMSEYRVVCLPPRALWPGEPPPAQRRQWDALAHDFLAGLREHNLKEVVAVGHSFGGIASLLAANAEPGRFRALCLLDPTIFIPDIMQGMARMQMDGSINDFPLVRGAKRRRQTFASVDEAYEYFKSRPLFDDWPDETVRLYAEAGTRPAADGNGRELAWSAEWEAYYFSTAYTHTWEILPQLRRKLPILTVRGGTTDTLMPEAAAKMQDILPDMAYAEVADHGHLFPQTAPHKTAMIIQKWLKSL